AGDRLVVQVRADIVDKHHGAQGPLPPAEAPPPSPGNQIADLAEHVDRGQRADGLDLLLQNPHRIDIERPGPDRGVQIVADIQVDPALRHGPDVGEASIHPGLNLTQLLVGYGAVYSDRLHVRQESR